VSINWRQVLNLVALLICLFLDLGSKYWARIHLHLGNSQIFIPGLINLTLTSNTGFAFSIGQGHKIIAQTISIIIYIILVIVYLQRYFFSSIQRVWLEQLGMSIVLGAALGNLLERLCYGAVTDFLEFAFINFPVFNGADVLIDTGIGLILISAYFFKTSTSIVV
jgi:signal peptidase II